MKDDTILMSTIYDISVPIMIFFVSVGIMLKIDNSWLLYNNIMAIISSVAYCVLSARFLELCSIGENADLEKKLSGVAKLIMISFFVVELIAYGVQYGL